MTDLELFVKVEQNLDNSYNFLMETREKGLIEREALEQMILGDTKLRDRLALEYWLRHMNVVPEEASIDWSVAQFRRELEPMHTKGWRK